MGLSQVISRLSEGTKPSPQTPGRSRRVVLLLAAVALMSVADLALTLEYATSVGLFEGNPVARAVMSYNSASLLAAWKLSSVGVCLWILFRTRHTRSGEVGAWVCFGTLAWLTVCWTGYNSQMAEIASSAPVLGLEIPTDKPLMTMTQ
jgi:hypothetical protein